MSQNTSPTRGECQICYEYEELTLLQCGHRNICELCIVTDFEHLQEATPSICCIECESLITFQSIQHLLPPKLILRLQENMPSWSTPPRYRVYCSNKYCGKFAGSEESGKPISCTHCSSVTCAHCSQPNHTGKCVRNSEFDQTLQSVKDNPNCRACSECGHMIMRNLACAHLSCFCGHQFCLCCGVKWRTGHTCPGSIADEQARLRAGEFDFDDEDEDDINIGGDDAHLRAFVPINGNNIDIHDDLDLEDDFLPDYESDDEIDRLLNDENPSSWNAEDDQEQYEDLPIIYRMQRLHTLLVFNAIIHEVYLTDMSREDLEDIVDIRIAVLNVTEDESASLEVADMVNRQVTRLIFRLDSRDFPLPPLTIRGRGDNLLYLAEHFLGPLGVLEHISQEL